MKNELQVLLNFYNSYSCIKKILFFGQVKESNPWPSRGQFSEFDIKAKIKRKGSHLCSSSCDRNRCRSRRSSDAEGSGPKFRSSKTSLVFPKHKWTRHDEKENETGTNRAERDTTKHEMSSSSYNLGHLYRHEMGMVEKCPTVKSPNVKVS